MYVSIAVRDQMIIAIFSDLDVIKMKYRQYRDNNSSADSYLNFQAIAKWTKRKRIKKLTIEIEEKYVT